MREIKFRAKTVDGIWFGWKLTDPIDMESMVGAIDWSTLGQYTGLKDENDKEIYEGDVIKFTVWWFDGNEAESTLIGSIVYSALNMSFQLKGIQNKEWEEFTGCVGDFEYYTPFSELCFDGADFEVIGNIFENPKLLSSQGDI